MDDKRIVELYWQRDESAIAETQKKYGKYCYSVAYNILGHHHDAEECVNDTYLKAWNSIPPQKPQTLSVFLGVITRSISLNRWKMIRAEKRGGGEMELIFSELDEMFSSETTVQDEFENRALGEAISKFLESLSETERVIFMRRYWHCDSIKIISEAFGFGQGKIKMLLKRTREKMAVYLAKEGITV